MGTGARVVHCKELVVVKECATFVAQTEYSGNPYVALDYITPEGWFRVKGVAHFCPKHAEAKRNIQKDSLPEYQPIDTLAPVENKEEPTRKIKIPDRKIK